MIATCAENEGGCVYQREAFLGFEVYIDPSKQEGSNKANLNQLHCCCFDQLATLYRALTLEGNYLRKR